MKKLASLVRGKEIIMKQTDVTRLELVKAEIARLERLREDIRRKEVKFDKLIKTAKPLSWQKAGDCCNHFDYPEYKLRDVYHSIGWELTSKIDSLYTYLCENENK